jgi:hypothetical protein
LISGITEFDTDGVGLLFMYNLMNEISTFPRHMGCADKEYFLVLKGQMVDIVAVGHGTLLYA